ncbi:unnamed protein product [Ostreobium quekettii]|uniref:Uncharacterized protein n=1 Tax=Ostreobium quekettii TaxID=121088 RepID=A0A8S1IKC0_9CHLO|nr:unnamed protein product [Ostreobium quekettii]
MDWNACNIADLGLVRSKGEDLRRPASALLPLEVPARYNGRNPFGAQGHLVPSRLALSLWKTCQDKLCSFPLLVKDAVRLFQLQWKMVQRSLGAIEHRCQVLGSNRA